MQREQISIYDDLCDAKMDIYALVYIDTDIMPLFL